MDKEALKKHEIYNNLAEFTGEELSTIADFIDFMRHKKQLEDKKIIKLEGILKGHDIDFSELKKLKKEQYNYIIIKISGVPDPIKKGVQIALSLEVFIPS